MIQLMSGPCADTAPRAVLGEIFDVVMQQGVTRLKADTKLSHLIGEEGPGLSQRQQKYNAFIDEMRDVSVGMASWGRCGKWEED